MAKVHPGATLIPHFREFLPAWVARQPWYAGADGPSLTMVGAFRLEDPAGAVGIETHLLSDGMAIYQVPMTYRDAPLAEAGPALIATAEHSVLGTRWIYDGPADPVWSGQMLDLVRTGGVSESSAKRTAGPAEARGRLLDRAATLAPETVAIDLRRSLSSDDPGPGPGALGVVTGTWYPGGPHADPATGWLAVLRPR
jgi:Maltokinase N-terminal cap domain